MWSTGKTYEYQYSGLISTGMMGFSPKMSGGSISGRLMVQVIDEDTIDIAVIHFK